MAEDETGAKEAIPKLGGQGPLPPLAAATVNWNFDDKSFTTVGRRL